MILEYYQYKEEHLKCNKCKWSGLGKDCKQGDIYEELFEIDCPSCLEKIAIISFPTTEEAMEFGAEEDKEQAMDIELFQGVMELTKLKSIEQLPEIDDDQITFEVIEHNEGDFNFLKIAWKGDEIWNELTGYEYYKRFIELGKMFKEKYGSKMIDFVPKGNGYLLYGDKISAPKEIEAFRASLK